MPYSLPKIILNLNHLLSVKVHLVIEKEVPIKSLKGPLIAKIKKLNKEIIQDENRCLHSI